MNGLTAEPAERPQIKRAFWFATSPWSTFMAFLLVRGGLLVAVIVGISSHWYYGVACYAAIWGCLFAMMRLAGCPRCGKVWKDEDVDSLVCTRCRLDIHSGLADA